MPESRIAVLRQKLKAHRGRLISSVVSAGLGGWLDRCTRFVDWVSRVDTVSLHRHEIPQFVAVTIAHVGHWTPEICYGASVAFVVWWLTGKEVVRPHKADSHPRMNHILKEWAEKQADAERRTKEHDRKVSEAVNDLIRGKHIVRVERSVVPTPPQPNIIATLPRVLQAYIGNAGAIHLGVNPAHTSLPFEDRHGSGHIVLAPFKNEPDRDHPRVRKATSVAASVRLDKIDDFPVTGYWLDSADRLVDIDVAAPDQSVVIAFVGPSYAALVRDQRSTNEKCIDYQTFWLGPKGTNVNEVTIVVKLMEGGELLRETEYLIKLTGYVPVVYLTTPSEPHTSTSESQ